MVIDKSERIVRDKREIKALLHLAHPKLISEQLEEWIEPYFNKFRFTGVLVRHPKLYFKLKNDYPNLQLYYAKGALNVEEIISTHPGLHVLFYTFNTVKNIHTLRYNHLRHIFIGTKLENRIRTYDKSYRAYDEIWIKEPFLRKKIIKDVGDIRHLQIRVVEEELNLNDVIEIF